MNLLLIAASFFGYSSAIKSALELKGYKVLLFEDRPSVDTLSKGLIRVSPSLLRQRTETYFNEIIAQARAHDVREVMVIKGESLAPHIVARMRRALRDARFTLYFWDSYRNMPADAPAKVAHFHRAFTFDRSDANIDSRLTYRPLFFLNEYSKMAQASPGIDVLFIGTAHSDRYAVLSRLKRALPQDIVFRCVLFMPSPYLFWARKAFDPDFWPARKAEFIFQPLNQTQIMDLIRRARIVVDIERPVQTGLTMRTVEMLGASRKLITTNPKIREADFYRDCNHIHIDRRFPNIPRTFLDAPWQTYPPQVLFRYSLDGWLAEVLPDAP